MNWFNKQTGRKYLYLLWSPFNGIWKVGITTKFDSRLANIRKTTGEMILPIFKAKIVNAKKVEQRILRHFKPWRVNWKGSGKTEWLKMPLLVTPFLLIEFAWMRYKWLILLVVGGVLVYSNGLIEELNNE